MSELIRPYSVEPEDAEGRKSLKDSWQEGHHQWREAHNHFSQAFQAELSYCLLSRGAMLRYHPQWDLSTIEATTTSPVPSRTT
jgi:hypothetical protein